MLKKLLFSLSILFFTYSCDDGLGNEPLIGKYEEKELGYAANDLLSNSSFSALKVQVLYQPGMQPTTGGLDYLENFLNERLNKPGGISIILKSIPTENRNSYSVNQLIDLEEQHRDIYNEEDTLSICFLFVDAEYAGNNGNAKALGIAYRSTSMTIFQETIKANSGGPLEPSQSTLESAVLGHEMGHILGLVNVGTDMVNDHQDEAHGAHCDVEDCLMYYAAETTASLGNLTGGNIPELDAQCIADLRASGGK